MAIFCDIRLLLGNRCGQVITVDQTDIATSGQSRPLSVNSRSHTLSGDDHIRLIATLCTVVLTTAGHQDQAMWAICCEDFRSLRRESRPIEHSHITHDVLDSSTREILDRDLISKG